MKFNIFLMAVFVFMSSAVLRAQQRGNQPQPGPPPILTKVKNDLYLIENPGLTVSDIGVYGGNMTFYVTDEGLILIDSKNERIHADVLSKIKTVTDKPVRYLILSHNHGDHAAGAPLFQAEGADVIMSAEDRDNLARTPGQKWLPRLTYSGQAKIYLGGKEADLYEFRGHTRGDTVVYLPQNRTIILGDLLVSVESIPYIINVPDGGSWGDWMTSMDAVLKMDWDTAIPGHGPMLTRDGVRTVRDNFVRILERVRTLNRERKTQDEIAKALLDEFKYTGNVTSMVQELR